MPSKLVIGVIALVVISVVVVGVILATRKSVCKPNCTGKTCGTNGCNGSCGTCAPGTICVNGSCQCVPNCIGKTCGSNGCSGSCGSCTAPQTCVNGNCITPDPCSAACPENMDPNYCDCSASRFSNSCTTSNLNWNSPNAADWFESRILNQTAPARAQRFFDTDQKTWIISCDSSQIDVSRIFNALKTQYGASSNFLDYIKNAGIPGSIEFQNIGSVGQSIISADCSMGAGPANQYPICH